MKPLLLLALLLTQAVPAWAGVYYVNKGVRYHIGDNRYSQSEDSVFMDAHPVVGPRWVQRFKVDRADRVRVRIDEVFGVDDCPYCKVLISIDGTPMARLYAENNRQGFSTPDVLAVAVEPGVVHELSIESIGGDSVDDFVISGVVVETAVAEVEMLPGPNIEGEAQEPPRFVPSGCGSEPAPQPLLDLKAPLRLFSASEPKVLAAQAGLAPGQGWGFSFKVNRSLDVDAVGQALEWRVGDSGWSLNWAPGQDRVLFGNLRRDGRFRAERFEAVAYRPGAWNQLRLGRCQDGSYQLSLNGQALGPLLGKSDLNKPLSALWVRGLAVDLKE